MPGQIQKKLPALILGAVGIVILGHEVGCKAAPPPTKEPPMTTTSASSAPPPAPPVPDVVPMPPPEPPPRPVPPPPDSAFTPTKHKHTKAAPPWGDSTEAIRPAASSPPPVPPSLHRFPFPPPKGSSEVVLPPLTMPGGAVPQTLGDFDTVLSAALSQTGYGNKGYYAIPNGFALATQMEQIFPDGRPMAIPARFQDSPPLPPIFTVDYLRGIFMPRQGYFRVIVFLVTGDSFEPDVEAPTEATAVSWPLGGSNVLPVSIAQLPKPPGVSVTAMIYEFRSSTATGTSNFMMLAPGAVPDGDSLLDGRTHLTQAGLWVALRLQ